MALGTLLVPTEELVKTWETQTVATVEKVGISTQDETVSILL